MFKLIKDYFDLGGICADANDDVVVEELESEVKELTQKLKVERDVVYDLKTELTRLSSELLRVTDEFAKEKTRLNEVIEESNSVNANIVRRIADLRIAEQSNREEIAGLKKIIEDKDSIIAAQVASLNKETFAVSCLESRAKAWQKEYEKADKDRKLALLRVSVLFFGWAVSTIAFWNLTY